MSFTDYMVVKLLVMVFLAFCWGVFCGITGRNLRGEPHAKGSDAPGPQSGSPTR